MMGKLDSRRLPIPRDRRRQRSDGERGAVTLWMALLATVVFFVVALVVDGSGLIQATQQADDIARSAARSAGQEIDRASLSGPLVVSHGAAIEAGQDFMSAAGCLSTSTVTISDDMVEATCDLDYRPVFTGLLASTTVRGQGRSQAVHVYEGVPK